MCATCVFCEAKIDNVPVSVGGEYFHADCYDLYMCELEAAHPADHCDLDESDFEDQDPIDLYGPECDYQEYDCDPNPYHGDYSEM